LTVRETLRRRVRSAGFDVVRYPNPTGSLGPHLAAILDRTGIDTVLDVGAHHGEYGGLLRQAGFSGKIVSFEPVSASFSVLERRAAADGNWTAHRLALGSRNGSADINVASDSDLSSVLPTTAYARTLFSHAASVIGREAVDVRRLDAILDRCLDGGGERGLFLKTDTQGLDLEVIAGATACLDRICGLQVELSVKPIYDGMPSHVEALSALRDYGFSPTGMFPVQRDEKLRIVEFDCVFVRAACD
jgi:FkbM family methyltransferase